MRHTTRLLAARLAPTLDAYDPDHPLLGPGLQPGDIIVALAGQPVTKATHVEQMMSRLRPHHPPMRIYRNGRTAELTLDI
jgi:C-terminal processing protease CtpA/Prc